MAMKTQKAVALLVVLITLGCVEPLVTSSSDGISVTLYSEPEVYGSGEERIEAFLDVQNIGDSLATNVKADLFNYGDLSGDLSADLGALEPHGKDYPGESQDYSFILSVPHLGTGLQDTIELGARVSYGYSSFGKADIPVIPKEDWKVREGLEATYPLEQYHSSGPLSILIAPSKSPVLVSPDYTTFGLRIVIDNIGRGRLKDDSLSTASLEAPEGITLANPHLCDFDGELNSTNKVLTITDPNHLKMLQGKRKTLICRFNVTDIDLENTYGFQTTLTYTYEVDAFTPISVIGTEPA